MDELTSEICTEAKENDTAQLIDWRDRKVYWVTKLADKNCWMTQNLDYDDPSSLRREDLSDWSTTNTVQQYWDPGLKIINGDTFKVATRQDDEHLLIGNYYSWQSAVAGSGKNNGDAGDSICPEGWQLPLSGKDNTSSGSFTALQIAGNINNDGIILNKRPYYFQYGGIINSGKLSNTGSYGYYWSSTASTASVSDAYYLAFTASTVTPSSSYYARYVGLSVRCLVLGS